MFEPVDAQPTPDWPEEDEDLELDPEWAAAFLGPKNLGAFLLRWLARYFMHDTIARRKT